MTSAHETCLLTTTKINRLFRSLRAKCSALAAIAAVQKVSTVVTYSNPCYQVTGRIAEAATPPLTILPRPENITSLNKNDVENMQLSKKVYEVCDTFKNILQAAFGERHSIGAPPKSRTLSLATVCASTIGHELECHVQAVQEDEHNITADDASAMKIIEDMYESIPMHHRGHTLVAHALSLVLETCPPNHTLISVLLDSSLAYRLSECTDMLLRELLAICCRSNSSANVYPLCHPIHFDYLVVLRHSCCNPLIGPTRLHLNDKAWTGILVDALANSGGDITDLWTCRAISRLARILLRVDFTAYMHLCSGAALNMPVVASSAVPKKRSKHKRFIIESKEPPVDDRQPNQLAGWLRDTFPFLLDTSAHTDDKIHALATFLSDLTSVHSSRIRTPYLADMILSVCTLCLRSPAYATLSTEHKDVLKSILQSTRARSETYDALMLSILSNPQILPSASPSHPPNTPGIVQDCTAVVSTIHTLARPLRARAFHRLEASLWACALRNIEGTFCHAGLYSLGPGATAEIDRMRHEMVDLVERAEKRCFGARLAAMSQRALANGAGSATPSRPRLPVNPDDLSEWEWEDIIGTWVRKASPLVREPSKKRKFAGDGARSSGANEGEGDDVEMEQAPLAALFAPSKQPSRSQKKHTKGEDEEQTARPGLWYMI